MNRTLDSSRIVTPAYFAHVVLRVRDLKASMDWYARLVGMESVFANDLIAFMTYDAEHHRIALVQTPVQELPAPGSPGLDHVAYALSTLEELLATYVRLRELGIRPVLSINHGPTTSLYYEDPDGHRVEFQVDNFEDEAELKGWMESDTFRQNPIGVVFDPDKLVARYERGDPLEELLKQGATA